MQEEFKHIMESLPVSVSEEDIEEMFNFADKVGLYNIFIKHQICSYLWAIFYFRVFTSYHAPNKRLMNQTPHVQDRQNKQTKSNEQNDKDSTNNVQSGAHRILQGQMLA